MCCSKFILFTTNVILFIAGAITVGISSAIIHKGDEYGDLLLEGVFALPVIVLILGVLTSLLGFLGCFGALRESKWMLYTYSGIVLVLFIGEITLAVMIVANPEAMKDALKTGLESQFKQYEQDPPTAQAIDKLQQELSCCGVNGPNDWKTWGQTELPRSCCPTNTTKCEVKSGDVFQEGCYEALVNEFQSIVVALGVAGIVLAFFMFFSMSTACGLARK